MVEMKISEENLFREFGMKLRYNNNLLVLA